MSILGSRPKIPEIEPPAPIMDEEKVKMARKKNLSKQRKRTGRASTILSDEGLG